MVLCGFFLALFWCKIFYSYLKQITDKCLLWSFVISTIALVIGRYIVNLPFGILTGFCGMVFYAMGDYWKNEITAPIRNSYLLVGGVVWVFCILNAQVDLSLFVCHLYPVSMFAAFVGTYITYLAACKMPSSLKPTLCWIGRNTMLILCYHTLLFFIVFRNLKQYYFEPNGVTINGCVHLVFELILGVGLPIVHVTIKNYISKKRTENA